MSASPRMARKAWDWMWELDVRPVARALRVPTLVLHRTGDHAILVSMDIDWRGISPVLAYSSNLELIMLRGDQMSSAISLKRCGIS